MKRQASRETLESRFWSKVDKSRGSEGCWPWTAHVMRQGYGHFNRNKRMVKAHRLAFELENGAIPEGLCVCHRCDNRLCCNPSHLFLGTHADNMRDMALKGRHVATDRRGERNASAKLKAEDVVEIRALCGRGLTQPAVATLFGVSRSTVSMIMIGKAWGHLP